MFVDVQQSSADAAYFNSAVCKRCQVGEVAQFRRYLPAQLVPENDWLDQGLPGLAFWSVH